LLADKQTIINRAKICKDCDQLTPVVNICKSCGCFVNFKAAIANTSCPLEKWTAVEVFIPQTKI
jgi:hypothetical protein